MENKEQDKQNKEKLPKEVKGIFKIVKLAIRLFESVKNLVKKK